MPEEPYGLRAKKVAVRARGKRKFEPGRGKGKRHPGGGDGIPSRKVEKRAMGPYGGEGGDEGWEKHDQVRGGEKRGYKSPKERGCPKVRERGAGGGVRGSPGWVSCCGGGADRGDGVWKKR